MWKIQNRLLIAKNCKETEEFCKLLTSCSMRCARNPKETIDYHNDSRCQKTEEFSKRVFQKDLYWNVRNPKDTLNSFSRYPQVSWRLKNFEKSLEKVCYRRFLLELISELSKNVIIVCTQNFFLKSMPN